MKYVWLLLLAALFTTNLTAQQSIVLYPQGVPNAKPAPPNYREKNLNGTITMVTSPTLTAYFPEKGKGNGSAVIICPGGGYVHLASVHEGSDVAKKFNEIGVAAFVLKYRLPSEAIMPDQSVGPLQDAQRALQIVRQRAVEWGINPAKVGFVGFSAGGHLASTIGTHFEKAVIDNADNTNLRPDFLLLIYPRTTYGTKEKPGSVGVVVGKNAPQAMIDFYSNDKQVTKSTPPCFIVHAADDGTVPAQTSINFYKALLQNNVKAELHIYQAGGHGFGLNNKTTKDLWFERAANFLAQNGFLSI